MFGIDWPVCAFALRSRYNLRADKAPFAVPK